jgi:Ca-activated chloride channel homolog
MSVRLILVIALLAHLFSGAGDRNGRRGNEHYAHSRYDEAVDAFYAGLTSLRDGAPKRLLFALQNNLGAALLKSGEVDASREAFDRAASHAESAPDEALVSYNAGNAAYNGGDLESALELYRRSLRAAPNDFDAKFNYEYVKRRLDQQEQTEQEQAQDDDQDQGDESEQQDGSDDAEDGEEEQQQQDGQEQTDQNQQDGHQPERQEGLDEQRGPAPQQDPSGITPEEAERILQAIQSEEEQLLRRVQQPATRPRDVEKDW